MEDLQIEQKHCVKQREDDQQLETELSEQFSSIKLDPQDCIQRRELEVKYETWDVNGIDEQRTINDLYDERYRLPSYSHLDLNDPILETTFMPRWDEIQDRILMSRLEHHSYTEHNFLHFENIISEQVNDWFCTSIPPKAIKIAQKIPPVIRTRRDAINARRRFMASNAYAQAISLLLPVSAADELVCDYEHFARDYRQISLGAIRYALAELVTTWHFENCWHCEEAMFIAWLFEGRFLEAVIDWQKRFKIGIADDIAHRRYRTFVKPFVLYAQGLSTIPQFPSPKMRSKLKAILGTSSTQLGVHSAKLDEACLAGNKIQIEARVKRIRNTLDFTSSQLSQTLDTTSVTPTYIWSSDFKHALANNVRSFDEFIDVVGTNIISEPLDKVVCEYVANVQASITCFLEVIPNIDICTDKNKCQLNAPHLVAQGDSGLIEQNTGESVITNDLSENINMTYVESRGVVEDDTTKSRPVEETDDSTNALSEPIWQLNMMSSKPWKLASFNWNTSMERGHLIYDAIIPKEMFPSGNCNTPAERNSKMWTLGASGWKIEMKANSQGFLKGLVMMTVMIFPTQHNVDWYSYNSMKGFQATGFLDASIGNSAIVKCPFNHFLSTYNLRDSGNAKNQYQAVLRIYVYNQLRAATGAKSNVSITLMAEMIDPTYRIVAPYRDNLGFTGDSFPFNLRAQSAIETALAIGSSSEGQALLGQVVKMGAEFMGNCDAPRLAAPAVPMQLRSSENTAEGQGVNTSQRLSLYPLSYSQSDVKMLKVYGTMDIRDTITCPTRLGVFEIKPDDQIGKVVYKVPIYPTMAVSETWPKYDPTDVNDLHTVPPGVTYEPTALGYIARGSMYGRGPLDYTLTAVTTQHESCRLAISVMYGIKGVDIPTEYCELIMGPTVVWDIREHKIFKHTVPYNAVKPWMKIDKFWPMILNRTAATSAQRDWRDTLSPGNEFQGWLVFSIYNEWTGPTSIAQGCEINVDIAAHPDFELYNPSTFNQFFHFGSMHEDPVFKDLRLKAQGDTQVSVESRKYDPMGVTPSPMVMLSKKNRTMPEITMNFKDIMRRKFNVASFNITTSTTERVDDKSVWSLLRIPVRPCFVDNQEGQGGDDLLLNVSILGLYTQIKKFWRGSLRMSFWMSGFPADEMYVIFRPDVYGPIISRYRIPETRLMEAKNCGTVLFAGNVLSSVDVEIPFASTYKQLLTQVSFNDATEMNGSVELWFRNLGWEMETSGNTNIVRGVRVNLSVGDDFVMSQEVPPPKVTFRLCYDLNNHFHCPEAVEPKGDISEIDYYECSPLVMTAKVKNIIDNVYARYKAGVCADHCYIAIPGVTSWWDILRNPTADPQSCGQSWMFLQQSQIQSIQPILNQGKGSAAYDYMHSLLPFVGPDGSCLVRADEPTDMHAQLGPSASEIVGEFLNHDEISETLKSVNTMCGNIGPAATSIKEAAERITQTSQMTQPLFQQCVDLNRKLGSTIDKVDSVLGCFSEPSKTNPTTILAIVGNIYNFLKAYSMEERMISLISLGALLGIDGGLVVKSITNAISFCFGKVIPVEVQEGLKPQGEWLESLKIGVMEYSGALKILLVTVATAIFALIANRLPDRKLTMTFVERFIDKARAMHFMTLGMKGLQWVAETVMKMVNKSFVWALGESAPGFLSSRWLKNSQPEVIEWLKKLDSFEGEANEIVKFEDINSMAEVNRLIDLGYVFLEVFKNDRSSSCFQSFVRDGLRRANIIKNKLVLNLAIMPIRIDPYFLCCTGASGIGKSAETFNITSDVMDRLGYPKAGRLYSKNDLDPFWARYKGQKAILFDDLFQWDDSEVVRALISIKSNVAYLLNMNINEEKGQPIMAELLFGTTNTPYPNPPGLVCKEALHRRRNCLFELREGPQHTKEYRVLDSINVGAFRTSWLSYKNFIDFVVDEARAYLARQRTFVTDCLVRHEVVIPDYVARSLVVDASNVNTNLRVQDLKTGEITYFDQWVLDQQVRRPTEKKNVIADAVRGYNSIIGECNIDEMMFCVSQEKSQANPLAVYQTETHNKIYAKHIHTVLDAARERSLRWEKSGQRILPPSDFIEDNEIDPYFFEVLCLDEKGFLWLDPDCVYYKENPERYELEYELLLESFTKDQLKPYARQITTPALENGEKLPKKKCRFTWFQELIVKAENICKNFLKEHPWLEKGLKIIAVIGAILSVVGVAKMIAPRYVDGINDKICSLFGFEKEKEETSEYRKALHSVMINDSPYEKPVCKIAGKVRKMFERIKDKLRNKSEAITEDEIEDLILEAQSAYNAGGIKTSPKPTIVPSGLHSQGEKAYRELIRHVILPNCVYITAKTSSDRIESMRGFVARGRSLVLPWHFLSRIVSGTQFAVLQPNGITLKFFLLDGMIEQIQNMDAGVLHLPVAFPQKKDIVRHFISQTSLANVSSVQATLVGGVDARAHDEGILTVRELEVRAFSQVIKRYDNVDGCEYLNQLGWHYEAPTKPGDCGQVLIAHSDAMPRKLLGFHVCGSDTVAYGCSLVLTKELLEKYTISEMQEPRVTIIDPIVEPMLHPQGNFTIHGGLRPADSVVLPQKTDIRKSKIHGMIFEPRKGPSVLTSRDSRNESGTSPVNNAIIKYGQPSSEFPQQIVDYVTQDLILEIVGQWKLSFPARLLTTREIICGDPEVEFLDSMNMNTSPGYPYRIEERGQKGKGYLFDLEKGEIKSEKLQQRYAERLRRARSKNLVESYWMDCLKDELRPLDKIKQGKTRMFTIPSVDYTMLMRKYTMSFVVNFYANRHRFFSAVGVDAYSYEWHMFAIKALGKSNLFMAGDYATFDGRIGAQMIMSVCQIIAGYYEHLGNMTTEEIEELQSVLYVLFYESIHTFHVCMNLVYQSHQGNKSGNPITTPLNTCVSVMYMRVAYLLLALKCEPKLAGMEHYRTYVSEKAYGDDNFLAVSGEISSWFNQITVSECLAEYGVGYTDESKSGVSSSLRRLEEITFLKNGFRLDRGLYVATMDKVTIEELTNWVRGNVIGNDETRQNCCEALRFAYFWGEDYYEDLRKKINVALIKQNIMGIGESYGFADHAWRVKVGIANPQFEGV